MGTPVDPIGWVILAATVASTGASVYGSMQQAAVQKGMYQAEARARELEAKQADLQARQISAKHLSELNANLGAIVAMRAGKNTMGDSPTGEAIIRSFTRESLGAKGNDVLDARLRALSARNAIAAANMQARAAGQAGTINAIGALADGISSAGSIIRRPSGSAGASILSKRKPTTRDGNTKDGGG